MIYRIRFKPSAAEAVRKLPKPQQRRVIARVEELAEDPRPPGCRKLAGPGDFYRVRTGDYRVIYSIEDRSLIVLVLRVGHRGGVYRRPSTR